MMGKGLLVVISAPSGGGKTTVIREVLASGNDNYRYSISTTTRARRPNEIHGRDYHFLSKEEFIRKREKGCFIEWAEVHGNLYATPKAQLEKWLDEGRVVFLDLDVDGGLAVKKQFGDSALLIFIKPPSFDSLFRRLEARNTESRAHIQKRLERYPKEIQKSVYYDCAIVNEKLEETVENIFRILTNRFVIGGTIHD
ncbi:MAG: guanylate kinase [bacterium]